MNHHNRPAFCDVLVHAIPLFGPPKVAWNQAFRGVFADWAARRAAQLRDNGIPDAEIAAQLAIEAQAFQLSISDAIAQGIALSGAVAA